MRETFRKQPQHEPENGSPNGPILRMAPQMLPKIDPKELRQDKTRHGKARQGKARQDKTRQDKPRQDKTRQDKARQGKARQGNAGHGKTRNGSKKHLTTSGNQRRNNRTI